MFTDIYAFSVGVATAMIGYPGTTFLTIDAFPKSDHTRTWIDRYILVA